MTSVPPLSAAVLAGGQSRRMGRNKALLPLRDGGPTMLELVMDHLGAIADDIMIVANERALYETFRARVVPDTFPGAAALGGIHSALTHARNDHCLVVACDMPFLNRRLLQAMAATPRDYDVLAPRLSGHSRQGRDGFVFQTLHAIYGKGAAPYIEAQLKRDNRQIVGFFDQVRLHVFDEPAVRQWDPELHSFFNANTPDALAASRRLAEEREGNRGR